MVFFIGTVRTSQKNQVLRMEIEAYDQMCRNALEEITAQACSQFPINDIFLHHRKGTLRVKDTILVIGVSASHRQGAFDACRFILEKIKTMVPIWKKEIYTEGEIWVEGEKNENFRSQEEDR